MKRSLPVVLPLLLALAAVVIYQKKLHSQMTDFGVYRTAAERVVRAEPLYRETDGHYQFKYLPAFAILIAPISTFNIETAKATWFAVSFGLLLVYVRWSVRALPERRASEGVLMAITTLLMLKFFGHELTLGQTNLLLGVLLVAALLAIQIDRPVPAGVLIGLAVFVKPYAIILAPWLWATHGRRAMTALMTVLAIGLLAPVLVYGWHGNLTLLASWYQTVSATTAPNLTNPDNVSLAGLWTKWIGPGAIAATLAAASSAAVVAFIANVWIKRRAVADADFLDMALLMLVIPILSPQGWDYVLLLATPAVICVVDRWTELSIVWRTLVAVCLATMGLTIFDVMGRALYGRFMALSLVTVAALGLAAALGQLRNRALA